MRTKAEFRATRERVGITTTALANAMHVSTRSVRYWEDNDSSRSIPDEAWNIIDNALVKQREVMAFALSKVDEIIEDMGVAPAQVQLPYWNSQKGYLAHSTDAKHGVIGDYHMANANNRAVALLLEQRGIDVAWVDGNPARPNQMA